MTKETKDLTQYITSIAFLTVGIILCIIDFFMEPPGLIHDTSLYFVGEAMTFVGAVFGISIHYSAQLESFKQEIKQDLQHGRD